MDGDDVDGSDRKWVNRSMILVMMVVGGAKWPLMTGLCVLGLLNPHVHQ